MRLPSSFGVRSAPILLGLSLLSACGGSVATSSDEGPGGGTTSAGGGAASTGGAGTGGTYGDGGIVGVGGSVGGCFDTDGDGLSDEVEIQTESNLPVTWDRFEPNQLDTDSDKDTIEDRIEAGAHGPCEDGQDTDGDGLPNYVDYDSDGDYVHDSAEIAHGTDPLLVDTDHDGCDDFSEVAFSECNPENLVVIAPKCEATTTTVTLVVGNDLPSDLNDLTLTLTPVQGTLDNQDKAVIEATPVSASPAGAAIIQNGKLVSVDPEAMVDVEVFYDGQGAGIDSYWNVAIVSSSNGVLATRKVAWITANCPVLLY